MTYLPLGQVSTLSKPSGAVITYLYDPRELLISRIYGGTAPSATDSFAYYPNHLLSGGTGGIYNTVVSRGTLNTCYDAANRLIQESQTVSALTKTMSFGYTPDSLVSSIGYPDGSTTIGRNYNSHRLLYQTLTGSSTQASFFYDPADRRIKMAYSGSVETTNWNLDADSRITDLNVQITGGTLQDWQYGYTAAGDPLAQLDNSFGTMGEAYQYDPLHRLTAYQRGDVSGSNTVTAPVSTQSWSLTPAGDWSQWMTTALTTTATETRTHNNIHALTTRSLAAAPMQYDSDQNQRDDGVQYTFVYDANDQLQAVRDRGTLALIASYNYDLFGRRVQKFVQSSGTSTIYAYNGQQVVQEFLNGAGTASATYSYGDDIDECLTMNRSGATYYYHTNRLGSTYLLSNGSGGIIERYSYTPYGSVTVSNSAYGLLGLGTTSSVGNPYLFTGRELDGETLLYNCRARAYDPVQGRFKQLDPISYIGGDANLYNYCRCNPATYVDRGGLAATDAVDPVRGVGIDPTCHSVCGPDVTKWFFDDLNEQLKWVDATGKKSAGHAPRYLETARFFFGYKWLDFSVPDATCGTDPCANTVWLGGICVRKNVLGNIALGVLAAKSPMKTTAADDIQLAYEGSFPVPSVKFYNEPASLAGMQRADNLAAFGVGDYISDSLTDYGAFVPVLRNAFSYGTNNYAWLYYNDSKRASPTFSLQTLVTTAPPGTAGTAFNTRSCRQCIRANGTAVVYSRLGGRTQILSLFERWKLYDKSWWELSTDRNFQIWLNSKYLNY